MQEKLRALHTRLHTAQRDLIIHSAEADALPSHGALRKIADLECAMSAVELLLQETAEKPINGCTAGLLAGESFSAA
jgi:hypothetical protein